MVEYSHHVPGRLRVQMSRLKRNASEIAKLQAALSAVAGVTSISANVATGSITILYDRRSLAPSALWETLDHLGYRPGRKADVQSVDRVADSAIIEKLISAAAAQIGKSALELALQRLVGQPAAALIGALI
jgi:copper chaperone CopZ